MVANQYELGARKWCFLIGRVDVTGESRGKWNHARKSYRSGMPCTEGACTRINTLLPPFQTRSVVSTLNCSVVSSLAHCAQRCDRRRSVLQKADACLTTKISIFPFSLNADLPLSSKHAPIAGCESPVVRYPITLRAPHWSHTPYTIAISILPRMGI